MMSIVDANPRLGFDWGTQYLGSKKPHTGLARNFLSFSVNVEYVNRNCLRAVMTSFDTAIVVATSDEDDAAFERFNSELAETLRLCTAPHFAKWKDCVSRGSFRAAEKVVIESRSFTEQFRDKAFYTVDNAFVLFRRALWEKRHNVSREDCQYYLDEFYRREDLHLDRITAEEFFREKSLEGCDRKPLPEAVRHEVWRRDQGKCTRCGGRIRLEFDHIIPIALGGSSTVRNLQLLCRDCNRSKGATLGRPAQGRC